MQEMVNRSDKEKLRGMKEGVSHWVQTVLDAVEECDASDEEEQK